MGGIRDVFWEKMVAKDYKTQGEKKTVSATALLAIYPNELNSYIHTKPTQRYLEHLMS